jgi:hypothetical protein
MTILKKIDMDTRVKTPNDVWPIIHSSMVPNTVTSFYGTDTEEDFLKNKLRLPADWIYHTKQIEYKFNACGLRMNKELDQVADNFLVAFGCSHTVGVGVSLEDTWPHLLAAELDLDYINSASSGSSVKLNCINFFNMLGNIKVLPKVVGFAWPSSVRHITYSKDEFLFYLPRFTSDKKDYKYHVQAYQAMLMTDILTYDAVIYRNMIKNTCNQLGIKYCEVTFDDRCEFAKKLNIDVAMLPKTLNTMARDVRDKTDNMYFAHAGVDTHQLAYQLLLKQL